MSTHLGQPPENHVVLMSFAPPPGDWRVSWQQMLPDGTVRGPPWRIPNGMMLVITDLDWSYQNSEFPPGTRVRLVFLTCGFQAVQERGYGVFETTAVLGPDSSCGANVALTTGFVVSSKAWINIYLWVGASGPNPPQVFLRGYLTNETPPKPWWSSPKSWWGG